ncbi:hypothetical protein BDN71DRAFT_1432450, partial [Pleurotus eryngii]
MTGAGRCFPKQADLFSCIPCQVKNLVHRMSSAGRHFPKQSDVFRNGWMLSAIYNTKSKNSPHQTSSTGRRFPKQADTFSCIQFQVQKLTTSDIQCRPTFSEMGRRFELLDKYWAGFLYISYLTFYFNQHPNSITWTTPGSDDVRYLVLTNIPDLATSKVEVDKAPTNFTLANCGTQNFMKEKKQYYAITSGAQVGVVKGVLMDSDTATVLIHRKCNHVHLLLLMSQPSTYLAGAQQLMSNTLTDVVG